MTDQTTEDTAAYCTCSAMRAIVDHHLKPMSAENTKLAAALTEAEAERESDPVVLDLRARLAEARELARRWQRDAHKHREIADSRPGLTQIERAQTRQAATEIEQCSRQLVAEIGPDPAERVETTTHADPEPTYTAVPDPAGHLRGLEVAHDAPGTATPGDDEQLTLDQAADVLRAWADDLATGRLTDWPHGEPDVIRGIAIAAKWVRARDRYETEAREQHLTALREAGRRLGESFQQLGEAIRDGAAKARAEHEEREQLRALVDRHGMADRTCLIGDDTRTPDAAVDAVVTILDRVVSGHLDDRDREGEDWSGPHPISIESDARRIIAAVQPHLLATAREAEEAPESAEPTLRDVMAAAYRAGLGLHKDVDDVNAYPHTGESWHLREWSITNPHGREVGRLEIETGPRQTYVRITSRRDKDVGKRVLVDPTLRDVLAAARLAGLITD